MQVLIIHPKAGKTKVIDLQQGIFIGLLLLLLISSAVFFFGMQVGARAKGVTILADSDTSYTRLKTKNTKNVNSSWQTEDRLNALALRLGQLQSQMLRLNAVGQHIVKNLNLGSDEFDFLELAPMGGIEGGRQDRFQSHDELSRQAENLMVQIRDRDLQLNRLVELLAIRDIQKQTYPAGRPIRKGWLSSYYGWRSDPFTGRQAFHHGIDFGGQQGADVVAVALGLVVSAERNGGYGNLVAIDHGNGYITRYGHNNDILVAVGDKVKQGETIAHMGSTGHSTGPHVHFEVVRHGKKIDPTKFIRTIR